MSSPTPARKRPHCHTCGSPMSGHKRINSKPVCRDVNLITPPALPTVRRSPRFIPEVVIPPYDHSRLRAPRTKRERLSSPVPTDLYDELSKSEGGEEAEGGTSSQLLSHAVSALHTSSFRSITRSLNLDKPLASLFTSSKSQADAIQRHAGELGLFSGAVYKPPRIKEEESERWVVMGPDGDAVDRLLDYQQHDVTRRFRSKSRVPGELIEVESTTVKGHGLGFLHVVLAGAIGGFIVFYCLVHF